MYSPVESVSKQGFALMPWSLHMYVDTWKDLFVCYMRSYVNGQFKTDMMSYIHRWSKTRLQDFPYQSVQENTKRTYNIPNDHIIYQTATKYAQFSKFTLIGIFGMKMSGNTVSNTLPKRVDHFLSSYSLSVLMTWRHYLEFYTTLINSFYAIISNSQTQFTAY
jgi:hypothetical protein